MIESFYIYIYISINRGWFVSKPMELSHVSIWNMGRYVILLQHQKMLVFLGWITTHISFWSSITEVPGIGEMPNLNADCNKVVPHS